MITEIVLTEVTEPSCVRAIRVSKEKSVGLRSMSANKTPVPMVVFVSIRLMPSNADVRQSSTVSFYSLVFYSLGNIVAQWRHHFSREGGGIDGIDDFCECE